MPTSNDTTALVNVIMGSKSDWATMKGASDLFTEFGIAHECRVLSAHRTPRETTEYVGSAHERGVEVIVAAAGGAAHLAGVAAAHTVLPVLGVPMQGWALDGLDALLSTVQMPKGIPVATFAIGQAGAVNAALFAISVLSATRPELRKQLEQYRQQQADAILNDSLE